MNRKFNSGVTLVELLVVVLIIGILASIAVPSYRNYVIRTNRTDAKTALVTTAAALERCYSRNRSYSSGCTVAASFTSNDAKYQITVVPSADGENFTLTATPLGGQLQDTQCANFVLTDANVRTVTGTKSATPLECWSK